MSPPQEEACPFPREYVCNTEGTLHTFHSCSCKQTPEGHPPRGINGVEVCSLSPLSGPKASSKHGKSRVPDFG